ncbi:hypothetical protein ACMGE7_08980 [Macrococcus equi]|uniref:hypothetical protein n=1 Tax=Macrococcus equi TaxID=3395462 RepID=UPI0039BE7E4A
MIKSFDKFKKYYFFFNLYIPLIFIWLLITKIAEDMLIEFIIYLLTCNFITSVALLLYKNPSK